jgi:hypothetical protein
MERYLTRIEKILKRVVVIHRVPAGSRQVTAEWNLVIVRNVFYDGAMA